MLFKEWKYLKQKYLIIFLFYLLSTHLIYHMMNFGGVQIMGFEWGKKKSKS